MARLLISRQVKPVSRQAGQPTLSYYKHNEKFMRKKGTTRGSPVKWTGSTNRVGSILINRSSYSIIESTVVLNVAYRYSFCWYLYLAKLLS